MKVGFNAKYGRNEILIPNSNQTIEFDLKYGKNEITFPVNNGTVVFDVKYGYNEIEIPVINVEKPIAGLSDIDNDVFTIINQIPQSQNVATKRAWAKRTLYGCGKRDGLFDKSSGTMIYKANAFTAYITDWEHYRAPKWLDDGYYAIADADKHDYYTANVGDLIIFADIPDEAPTTVAEFTVLTQKYKDIGGIISGVNVYVNKKPDGTPWKTNHIELIKG